MNVISRQLTSSIEALPDSSVANEKVTLVLVHGNSCALEEPALLKNLCIAFPNACIAGCSGAGEIVNGKAHENSIVYSAFEFDDTAVRQARIKLIENQDDEFAAGKDLARKLTGDDLVAVIFFSEGLAVDCDEVLRGVREILGPEAPFFGGLAGNSHSFEHTVVLDRDGVYDDSVVAVGLYGKNLEVNSSTSRFDQDGTLLEITATDGNIIYEINGEPALDVYHKLISAQTVFEMSSRLYFPLVVLNAENHQSLFCRTIHEYDNESKSLLAAGSVPIGPARMINMEDPKHLYQDAIETSLRLKDKAADFALIISCAGRRGALGEEWKKEAQLIQSNLENLPTLGFYSYGEIAKSSFDNSTIVHNHTLTIATFHET